MLTDTKVNKDGSVFSYGNSFYSGEIPGPLSKRDQVDPIAALKGVSSALGLSVTAEDAVAVPEASIEHYTIEGTSGAYQGTSFVYQYSS
jgi:extracellular elastinolytic metalloproteinase